MLRWSRITSDNIKTSVFFKFSEGTFIFILCPGVEGTAVFNIIQQYASFRHNTKDFFVFSSECPLCYSSTKEWQNNGVVKNGKMILKRKLLSLHIKIVKWKQTCNLCLWKYTLSDFKRKVWTWTRTSRSLVWRSTIQLSWFNCQFTLI